MIDYEEKTETIEDEPLQKKILDRWATVVIDKDAIWQTKEGESQVDANKARHYEEEGFKGTEVLWIAPKDSLVFEFEDAPPKKNERYIAECESAAKSLQFDYCITGHQGKSDYFRMFNIKGMPLGTDNKNAKLLLFDMLMPGSAKNMLDRTNLGWTLSPVIDGEHWKKKYNGNIHKIIRGKDPLKHYNEIPAKILSLIEKSKNVNKKKISSVKLSAKWVEDFLINFCCDNPLPKGARHSIIEKNLSAFILHRDDKDEIKKRYYEAQGRKHDSLRTWEIAVLNGNYTEISPGEIANFIKEYNIPYEIKTFTDNSSDGITNKAISLFLPNKDDLAEEFYKIKPFFYDKIGLFWIWNSDKCCYEMKDEYQLMNDIRAVATEKHFQVTENKFWFETLRALKLIGRKHEPKPFNKRWIQFGKTIYDYKTRESFESTPEYFNVNPIPFNIGKTNKTPVIDRLLTEWVGAENVKTLKQTIALTVLQDYPLHRIICLFGSGLNGKGEFLRMLEIFVGKNNICSSSLKKITKNNFESSKLYKKLVCVMGETDFSTIRDTGTIKQLSGQDLISAEYKGKNAFDFQNFATMFISSNSMPITEDRTLGFYRRWLIIDFPNRFTEGKKPLEDIPKEEYENLCCEVMDLLPMLIEKGLFDNDGGIEERKEKYEEKSNPLSTFFKEHYEKSVGSDVPFFEFFDRFCLYCSQAGFREITKKKVSMLLDELLHVETMKKDVKIDGKWTKWVHLLNVKVKDSNSSNTSNPELYPFLYVRNRVKSGFEVVERVGSDNKNHTNLTNSHTENDSEEKKDEKILTDFEIFENNLKEISQPFDIQVFYNNFFSERMSEERFERCLERAKTEGLCFESPSGYINKM